MFFPGFRRQILAGSMMRLEWPKLTSMTYFPSSKIFSALDRSL